jgi:hypothetical protein
VMKEEMKSKFSQWNIPLSSIPLHSREQKTCNRLFIAAREKTLPSISDSRLHNRLIVSNNIFLQKIFFKISTVLWIIVFPINGYLRTICLHY